MPLQINGKTIGSVFFGSTSIAEVYRGSTLVWQNVPKVTISQISDVWTKIKESNNFPRNDGRYWTRSDKLVTGVPNWNEYPLQEVPYRLVLAPGFTAGQGMFASYYTGNWTPENKLVTAPKMDTSRLVDMTAFFWNAVRLETVPEYTITACQSIKDFVGNCPKLKGLVLRDCGRVQDTRNMFGGGGDPNMPACTRVELHGLGPSLPNGHTVDLSKTALDAAGAKALFESLGTITSGRTVTLKLPTTALGAVQAVARNKGWTVTPTVDEVAITGKTGNESLTQFRAALTARSLNYETVTTLPFLLETSTATDLRLMFNGCKALTSVPEMDTSNVTSMVGVFQNCSALTSVPKMDTSKVTNMTYLFNGCTSLKTVPQMDTSNVTDMQQMFSGCAALTTVPQMDTGNVTNMLALFNGCSSLTSVPQMDTSKVTNMGNMFSGCTSLVTAPTVDMSAVTSTGSMFSGCTALTTVPQMDTRNVTTVYAMFNNCSALKTAPALNTSNVTDMTYLFNGCSSLTTVPQMDTSKVTQMMAMFQNCAALTSVPAMNTGNVINISFLFNRCLSLTTIPQLDTSNAQSMNSMLSGCSALAASMTLDMSECVTARYLFGSAPSSVTTPPVRTSVTLNNMGKVEDCTGMFGDSSDNPAPALTNVVLNGLGPSLATGMVLDLSRTSIGPSGAASLYASVGTVTSGRTVTMKMPDSALGARQGVARSKGWTVTPVVDEVVITGTSGTQARDSFRAALTARGLDYATVKTIPFLLDTSQVTNMRGMFTDCAALTSVPNIDTSNVTIMASMFSSCTALTSVPAMDTSKVTNTASMFFNCSSLTSAPAMDTSQVTNMYNMLNGCKALTSVPDMNTGQATNMSFMFYGCAALTDGNARCIGKNAGVNTGGMIDNSGMTRLPFYDTSGNWTG